MEIIKLYKGHELFDEAVNVFWKQWGTEENVDFYKDCMVHSFDSTDGIPSFYMAVKKQEIIGTYALIRNDLNSRQDLHPWLACLYVDPDHRGKAIGSQLLEHALAEAAGKGFDHLYLSSDLEGYYERYGWKHSGETYGVSGGSIKVYKKLV